MQTAGPFADSRLLFHGMHAPMPTQDRTLSTTHSYGVPLNQQSPRYRFGTVNYIQYGQPTSRTNLCAYQLCGMGTYTPPLSVTHGTKPQPIKHCSGHTLKQSSAREPTPEWPSLCLDQNSNYQLPITKWPRQRGAPVGAAPPTRSQLRLQRHTQVPVQNSHNGCHQPTLNPLLANVCQASPFRLAMC